MGRAETKLTAKTKTNLAAAFERTVAPKTQDPEKNDFITVCISSISSCLIMIGIYTAHHIN